MSCTLKTRDTIRNSCRLKICLAWKPTWAPSLRRDILADISLQPYRSFALDHSSALLRSTIFQEIYRPIMHQEHSRSMASSGKMKECPPLKPHLRIGNIPLNMIRSSALPPPRVTQPLHISSFNLMAFIGLHRMPSPCYLFSNTNLCCVLARSHTEEANHEDNRNNVSTTLA